MTDVLEGISERRGYFRLESGHHADRWFDLEALCLFPGRVQPLAAALAERLGPHRPDLVCGPIVEGAFVAMLVAGEGRWPFTYAVRESSGPSASMFAVRYRVPGGLHRHLRGRRVAVVNDVISAGSDALGTIADLQEIGATVVAVGTLVLLGDAFRQFAAGLALPVEALEQRAYEFWPPAACPLCAAGRELDDGLDA